MRSSLQVQILVRSGFEVIILYKPGWNVWAFLTDMRGVMNSEIMRMIETGED